MDSTTQSASPTRSSLSSHAIDASPKPRRKLLAALRKPAASSSEGESDSDDDARASDDELSTAATNIRPSTPSHPLPTVAPSSEGEDSDGGAAYERMKKRLAASKTPAEAQKGQEESHIVATIESSESEDAIPTRKHTRKPDARRPKSSSHAASPSPSARSRQSSPGLFVTPNASPAVRKQSKIFANAGSESDEPSHNADLQERTRRIRAERLARQQEQEQQPKPKKLARRVEQGSGSDTDGESGRRLTQQAKPTRKAGKKAMEAMARDQQRISRNMQLTHQAKTKKRYTTQDLFARYGFSAPNEQIEAAPTLGTGSTLASSDAELNQVQDTPPTSPPSQDGEAEKDVPTVASPKQHQDQLSAPAKIDKGKGRAPEFQHLPLQPWMEKVEPVIVQNAQVEVKKSTNEAMVELSDSEDEPQVAQPKSRFPVFDRLPTKKQHESASLQRLRSLAQLARSPQKGRNGERRVTLAEMERSLAQKARQQRNQQREERMAELRQRGHVIETEEEREKYQMEVEDLVAQFEKQRQEDLKLAKLEKDEAKKNGETIDDLPSSDESDGDYVGSGEENANEEVEDEAEVELELSGSEEEEMADDEQAEDEEMADISNGVVDDMADEDDEVEDAEVEDDDANIQVRKQTINRARNRVIDDDDESDNEPVDDALPTQKASQDEAMAAFGFGNANPSLGLTQMFAGTMANLESDSQSAPVNEEPEQDSLDFLRNLPETQPGVNFSQAGDFMVPNSQSLMSPQKQSQTDPETQFSLGISQLIATSPAFSRTQVEDFEPTQDAGFSFSRSPAGLVQPPSTIDTVMMPITESPIKERKGKLQRGRRDAAVELSDVDDDLLEGQEAESEDDIQRPPKPSDVFLKMKKAAKKQKAIDEFNKKTSMAKEAVMEQAEESEDEYAGLGGASDDDEGEEEQELKDMIDHNDVKVDERQMAAFYADKAKKEDEKNIADLYKKIQTGGLRRQAGGRDAFDMSDSEDEAEQRQRRRQADFQQMSRALLKDERVKKLADDPKKKSFFNTLADFADEGDYDFLDMPADIGMGGQDDEQSTPTQEDEVIPDSQTNDSLAVINPLKRKSPSSQKENRPPPNLRRTAAADNLTRKPLTFADVQHSVSELLDDPHIIVPESQYSDASDDDTAAPTRAARKPIVDRLSLSRTSSAIQHDGNSAMAFHAPDRATAAPGFRVPSLIRRATSSFSASSEGRGASGRSTPTEGAVRRGGTGRSNIHAQAREAERRAAVEKKEGKRKEALARKVKGGLKGRSVLAGLGGGFEE